MKSSIVWGGLSLVLIALGVAAPAVYGDLITANLVGRYETVGADPYTESGGRVSSWNDQTTTAENAVQTTASLKPYLVTNATPTGKAALDFRNTSGSTVNNAQQVTTGAVAGLDHVTSMTWFMVFNMDSIGSSSWSQWIFSSQYLKNGTALATKWGNSYSAGVGLRNSYRNDGNSLVYSMQPESSLDTDNWHVVSVTVTDNGSDAGTITSWLDGNNELTTSYVAPDPSDPGTCTLLRMGRAASSSASNAYDGMLAAVLVYNTNLSSSDRQSVETYLRETYIPEPGTLALLATGALGLLYGLRRSRKKGR
jgi:hypothetical protein